MKRRNPSVCFILDHELKSYRIPFFRSLSKEGYSITLCHIGNEINIPDIKEIILKNKTFLKFQYRVLPKLSEYDIVIHMQNLRVLNLWTLTLNPFRKFKLVHWGIGVSSSDGLSLERNLTSRIRDLLSSFTSAQILYSDFPLPLFSEYVRKKTFIAPNTIYNPSFHDYSDHIKDSFIFIGSLNKRKGLDDLLLAFSKFRKESNWELKLIIIGDGNEKERLKDLAVRLQIGNDVEFEGVVNNVAIKEMFFAKAIASISPKQAGLSVLESFSYGVPFICYKDAISGGEHLNIVNGNNGFLVKSQDELIKILLELASDTFLSKRLGHNAYLFYKEKRQMKHMVDAFKSAFEYVLSK